MIDITVDIAQRCLITNCKSLFGTQNISSNIAVLGTRNNNI